MQSDFSKRLEKVIESFESIHAFSKRAKMSDTMVRKYLAGTSVPGMENLMQMAEAGGVTLDWLAAEKGPMRREGWYDASFKSPDGTTSYVQFKSSRLQPIGDDFNGKMPLFSLVPRLDVTASAGSGSITDSEDALEYLAFQSEWLRSRGINPAAARVLTARGDSMEETIRDGDTLLVDTSINRVRDNAIYIVVYGDMVLVKRVHGRINGSMQLISDNPRYPAEEVSQVEVDQLNIAGRVMWFGRFM